MQTEPLAASQTDGNAKQMSASDRLTKPGRICKHQGKATSGLIAAELSACLKDKRTPGRVSNQSIIAQQMSLQQHLSTADPAGLTWPGSSMKVLELMLSGSHAYSASA